MNSSASLKQLGDKLQKLTNVKADTMRLIVPHLSSKGSKMLSPFSDKDSFLSLQEASIVKGRSVRMMGVPGDEIDKVMQNAKADMRIAGFEEEEMRLRRHISDGHHSSLKLPQGPYIFCDFRTLEIPGLELKPPASEALKRMHRLAADPGIVAVMNKHRWRVGIMTEMAPVGYVGVSPKCILGLNKNHGEEISLRLRTDDLKGFRKYESIKKTLLHELAHMVYSEHDANFYVLDKQLNEEAARLDWTKSRGYTVSGVRHLEHYEDDFYVQNSESSFQKLGGDMSKQFSNARASSVAAAYQRLANASSSSLKVSILPEEPEMDGSGFNMPEEYSQIDSVGNMDIDNLSPNDEHNIEDNCSTLNKFEPDPDDPELIKSSPVIFPIEEPDPDDSDAILTSKDVDEPLVMEILEQRAQLGNTFIEPDPDDRETKLECLRCPEHVKNNRDHYVPIETTEDEGHFNEVCKEPDPDDSTVNNIALAEPDPDDNLKSQIAEPDPDDQELKRIQNSVSGVCSRLQKAIEMLQVEVTASEANTVLLTLFKIIRNVIEHPDEMKFKRLRKANPIIQRNVANYKAAMEILLLIGFSEDVISNEIGNAETYLVLKRNDPGLLWLAKSSLEMCIAF